MAIKKKLLMILISSLERKQKKISGICIKVKENSKILTL